MAAVAACGGGGASPTVTLPTPTGTPGDPAATAAFKARVDKFEALASYHLVYDMKSTSDGKSTLSATMDATQKGKSTRSLFDGTVNGDPTKLLTIFDGKQLFICDEAKTKTCVQPASGPSLVDPLAIYSPAVILQGVMASKNITVHEAPGQSIGGSDAECYRLDQGAAQSTFCFDKESGLLVLIDGTTTVSGKTGTTTMRAKEASATVDSIDLKPPYEVQATATPTPG
jgi:hypothetical protein